MKKLSGIRYGQKRQRGQSDIVLLIDIQNYIRKRWHLDFKREWYVGFDKETEAVGIITEQVTSDISKDFKWRNPDLLLLHKQRGLIIIEIDGAVHDRKTEKTYRRNKQYESGHIKYIIINLAEVKEKNRTIKEEIDWKMMKLGL